MARSPEAGANATICIPELEYTYAYFPVKILRCRLPKEVLAFEKMPLRVNFPRLEPVLEAAPVFAPPRAVVVAFGCERVFREVNTLNPVAAVVVVLVLPATVLPTVSIREQVA